MNLDNRIVLSGIKSKLPVFVKNSPKESPKGVQEINCDKKASYLEFTIPII